MHVAAAVAQVAASGEDMVDALELLAELTRRPAWQARARCRGYGPGAFFAYNQEPAKATCRGCPVQVECAEAGEGEIGLWGGMTAPERRRVRREAG